MSIGKMFWTTANTDFTVFKIPISTFKMFQTQDSGISQEQIHCFDLYFSIKMLQFIMDLVLSSIRKIITQLKIEKSNLHINTLCRKFMIKL